jgi:small-conductance mechanosensitive channel
MDISLSDLSLVGGTAAIALGIFLTMEAISFVIRRVAKRAGAGPTVNRDIKDFSRLVAVVLIVSNVLHYTGLSSEFTALTVSGITAVAVSLALQTTLTNIISGVLLFNDGVMRLSDTIEYGSVKGEVVRIGLRNTWVKTDSGTLAVISNSSLSSGPLVNHSATDRLSKKYKFSQDFKPGEV